MTRALRLPLAVDEPRFAGVRAAEAALLPGIPVGRLKLSANAKTSVSLDFPIGQTCHPTAVCARTCYASRPGTPTMWPKSLRRRLSNWLTVRARPTDEVVAELRREFKHWAGLYRRRVDLKHLRFCGTGDLFPELVPVVEAFATARPDVAVWVVTRRFDLAERLAPAPNLFLQLSLDSSTPAVLAARARRIVAANPRAYISFLRVAADDDVRGAAVVFNEKRTEGLPYRSKTDCPVDAGALPLSNVKGQGGTACASCRKCFDERTLARQRGGVALEVA